VVLTLNDVNKSDALLSIIFVKFCCNIADSRTFHAAKSTDVTNPSASEPASDTVQPDVVVMRKSRKSLSLDNLQTAGDDSSLADAGDDLGPQSQSVMYARNMNQSFRVAVDKSYDGPSLAASLAG